MTSTRNAPEPALDDGGEQEDGDGEDEADPKAAPKIGNHHAVVVAVIVVAPVVAVRSVDWVLFATCVTVSMARVSVLAQVLLMIVPIHRSLVTVLDQFGQFIFFVANLLLLVLVVGAWCGLVVLGFWRRVPFTPTEDWTWTRLPFAELKASVHGEPFDAPVLNKQGVQQLGFYIIDGRDGPFRLGIGEIRGY